MHNGTTKIDKLIFFRFYAIQNRIKCAYICSFQPFTPRPPLDIPNPYPLQNMFPMTPMARFFSIALWDTHQRIFDSPALHLFSHIHFASKLHIAYSNSMQNSCEHTKSFHFIPREWYGKSADSHTPTHMYVQQPLFTLRQPNTFALPKSGKKKLTTAAASTVAMTTTGENETGKGIA